MPKTTRTYWNPLDQAHNGAWQAIAGLEGVAEELTLSHYTETGEYTRLTRFQPGADTTAFGGKSHAYPEEVFIVSGRLYDAAFDMWLDALLRNELGGIECAINDEQRHSSPSAKSFWTFFKKSVLHGRYYETLANSKPLAIASFPD